MRVELDKQNVDDLLDALRDAVEELTERAFGKYADYDPGDLAEIEEKLGRWNMLSERLRLRKDGAR